MTKYYGIYMDDFEALPFVSSWDEGWDGHALVFKEEVKNQFIAEQVANFTQHLLDSMYEVEEE